MGLASALRWYAEEYLERRGVALHVTTEGSQAHLEDHVELALYRIGQEALTNVARHAQAENVWITLACHNSRLTRSRSSGFWSGVFGSASGQVKRGLGAVIS